MTHNFWPASETELAEMRRFNRKLAWLPRFKIRNRVTPRVIQALLRAGQRLKRAPAAETRYAGSVPVRILPTVEHALSVSAVGSPQSVAAELDRLIARHRPDEVILVGNIYDRAARHRSFAIAAEILRARAETAPA